MADIILNRRQILSIIDNGQIDARYSSYEDYAYLPIPLAIYTIEREKKNGTRIPSVLKNVINNLPDCVVEISLSPHGLYEALTNPEFSEKYANRVGNPIEMATEACVYEYGCWDVSELLDSFLELSWI